MWPPVFPMIVAGVLCVFQAFVSADSETKIYKQVGDDVVLNSGCGNITAILWKNGVNLAIEWDGKDIDLYGHFEVRGALNTTTGEMTLRELTLNDSGLYTAEIKAVACKYPTLIRLIVILPVPKPNVSKTCDEEMTKCTLTCDAIITNAEPVEYVWNSDYSVLTTPVLNITKDESSSTFECVLKNPVSQEQSEPFPNPFTPAGKLNISAGLTVLIVLLVAVILTAIIHRIKAGMWFFEKASMPWEADFWRKHERQQPDAESNGTAAQEGLTEDFL